MSAVGLDIVVVNWNAGAQLRACLGSVAAARRETVSLERVVVVDNGSTDGSWEGLSDLPLPLTVLRNAENRGFGAACNQGARGSRADTLLFLNPDTRLAPDALDRAAAFLAAPERAAVGVCGIRLVDEEGRTHRSCARHPRPRHFATRLLGLDRIAPSLVPSLFMTEWDHASDRAVDHVMGAFLLIRRSLFESLGGFDERFFVYLEDLDLTLRAKRAGFATWFLAGPSAYHRSGGTSERAKAARLYYALHSRMLYGHKHFSLAAALVLDAGTLVVEPSLRLVAAAARGALDELRDTARGFAWLWGSVVTGRGPAATAGRRS